MQKKVIGLNLSYMEKMNIISNHTVKRVLHRLTDGSKSFFDVSHPS